MPQVAAHVHDAREIHVNGTTPPPDLNAKSVILQLRLGAPGMTKQVRKDEVEIKSKANLTAEQQDIHAEILDLRHALEQAGEAGDKAAVKETRALLKDKTAAFKAAARPQEESDGVGDPDPDSLKVSKELLDCEEFKEVTSYQREIRQYVVSRCVPSFLKEGMYRVNVRTLPALYKDLQEMKVDLMKLRDDFITVYPDRAKAQRKRLKGTWKPEDYPSPERMKAAITMEWRIFEWDVPSQKLSALSPEIAEAEMEKAVEDARESARKIEQYLWHEFYDLAKHIVEQLTPDENGKARRFHDTLTGNLNDFLETISERNLTGNANIAAMAERARKHMKGVTYETLKTSGETRAASQQFFSQLRDQLSHALQEAPTRRYLDED